MGNYHDLHALAGGQEQPPVQVMQVEEGTPVTAQRVALQLHRAVSTLRRRPLLWQSMLEQQQAEKEQREEQVFLNVQKAAEHLRQKGEEISLKNLCQITGYYPLILRSRPRIQAYLAIVRRQETDR